MLVVYVGEEGERTQGSSTGKRIIESMMGLRPRQGNLRLVFRLFSLMRDLRFPCRGLNPIIDCFSHLLYFLKQNSY